MSSIVLAIAVAFVAGVTYYGSREFSGRAADTRAATEAQSFAVHSSKLATGDAFDGYIQILRYADDPIVSNKSSSANDRSNAMQQLLYLNTNKFTSLTLADRSGIIFATTDSTITSVKNGPAFQDTRANLNPANSDIVLPEAGHHGYVEYSAPLRDTDGSVWGILIARADPARMWKGTLDAAVDGSRNVIINSEGQFAAGVPDELLRQPWKGVSLGDGRVRANIAGVDSICGLAPIGADTQIDRGLNVASCLPASIIQVEQHRSTGKQALVTLAAAVLAVVIGGAALKFMPQSPLATATAEPEPVEAVEPGPVAEDVDAGEPAESEEAEEAVAVVEAPPPPPPPPPPPADVDALALIAAYEQRNARLAERLREAVQARLLIAATQADEAYKLIATDEELSASLHGKAMAELEGVRDRELRSIGQDLYPGLVRLGLPSVLKSLKKDMRDLIEVKLELDSRADAVSDGNGRVALDPALRLVMFRFAADATRVLTLAGAHQCVITLERGQDALTLSVSAAEDDLLGGIDDTSLAADRIAVEAYAGTLAIENAGGRLHIGIELPATHVEELLPVLEEEPEEADETEDESEAEDIDLTALLSDDEDAAPAPDDDGDANEAQEASDAGVPPMTFVSLTAMPSAEDDETAAPATRVVAAGGSSDALAHGLRAALEQLQAEMFGSIVVALDVDPAVDGEGGVGPLPAPVQTALHGVVRDALAALNASDARKCAVALQRTGDDVVLSVTSETNSSAFDAADIEAHRAAIEALGGTLTVETGDDLLAVTVQMSAAAAAAA